MNTFYSVAFISQKYPFLEHDISYSSKLLDGTVFGSLIRLLKSIYDKHCIKLNGGTAKSSQKKALKQKGDWH